MILARSTWRTRRGLIGVVRRWRNHFTGVTPSVSFTVLAIAARNAIHVISTTRHLAVERPASPPGLILRGAEQRLPRSD